MTDVLRDRRIVLGVTGSIAAYKAVALASSLTQAGALVDVIMTREALELIRPLSFQAITHRPVSSELFHMLAETEIGHVSLGKSADAVLIAPCTANTLAKLSYGLADDMLTTTVLATDAPLIIAPAMDAGMYEHSAVQENVARLQQRGCVIVSPQEGYLASGRLGSGRLADQETILGTLRMALGSRGDLAGVQVVVTAGGTEEPIDPVRFVTNRSSGKMGYALAEAARDRGARVTLIHAPTGLVSPVGVHLVPVVTAAQMYDSVRLHYGRADVLIMAAAVADFRPRVAAEQKIKKQAAELSILLEPTEDILMATAQGERHPVRVGFAAETTSLQAYARAKVEAKRLDFIVANDVSRADSGFGTDTNLVSFIFADGRVLEYPLLSKRDVADAILNQVVAIRSREP
ncbi:MAG: bifunctional phosphopantothenoylcysteine decarboxylase/phosphopantothenate--cysteine ligase CoaBC [Chloroflexota bacterium]